VSPEGAALSAATDATAAAVRGRRSGAPLRGPLRVCRRLGPPPAPAKGRPPMAAMRAPARPGLRLPVVRPWRRLRAALMGPRERPLKRQHLYHCEKGSRW